jgi:hypothetical protein
VARDAPLASIGRLVFGECREETRSGPALLIRDRGELWLNGLDARQAKFAEQQFDPGGIYIIVLGRHAAISAPRRGCGVLRAVNSL